jgi:hypothetical protein
MGGVGRTPYFIGVTDFVPMRHSVEVLENWEFVADALLPCSPPEPFSSCVVFVIREFLPGQIILVDLYDPFHAPVIFALRMVEIR